jgi:Zn-dependent peptidase ImmA (M78 family)/transcriptional regulator with XRE-family HTH domain
MAEVKEALPVTPAVIQWARERAGFSIEDASKVFKKIAAWEVGEGAPSYPQLEQMADKFKTPVAVFFFPKPPDVPSVEKSFRTLSAADFAAIPRTVRLFLRRAQAMQLNLAELNDGKNPAPRLITRDLKVSPNTALNAIASEIRKYLGVTIEQQASWKSVDKAMEVWRDAFAKVGIYVFKDAFHAKTYFGFCLYDDEFPIIYVNNSCSKSRQIFTLFHELGHLLFHTSGIDVFDDEFIKHLPPNEQKIETICNGLAARVLVPDDIFERLMQGRKADRDSAAQLAAYFSVSREVIYRKLLDRNLIDAVEYSVAAKFWESQVKPAKESSGNFYNSRYAYLGPQYIDLAFTRYYQQRFDDLQLAEYLNLKPKNLQTFAEKFAGGGL